VQAPVVADLLEATERAVRADDGRVEVHAPGPGLTARLIRLEAETHDVLVNMQRSLTPSSHRASLHLNARSRGRGVREHVVVDRRSAASFPLATSAEPELRVGPVPVPVLVCDRRQALLPVPLGMPPEGGCCWTEDPDLVALALAAFDWTWERSVSWQEAGLRGPLPDRRFRVAVLLTDGYGDQEIADELGVSARTVSVEVRAVVDWLGARSRTHAVAMLVGAA
jgi:DNA-binding CsgD family transcriptional regulator